MSPAPADYVDVAERIQVFYAKYPDGRLTTDVAPFVLTLEGVEPDDNTKRHVKKGDPITQSFIVYTAKAYRTPDDPVPCVGTAWEPFPGKTNFTRDSELMNAETSAWGRAIIAVGFASKGSPIASLNEVRARTGDTLSDEAKAELRELHKTCGWKDPQLRAALKEVGVSNPTNVGTALAGLKEAQALELANLMRAAVPAVPPPQPLIPENPTPVKGGK